MPEDKSKKIDKSLDGLDDQIVGIVGKFVKRRRDHYEKAAKRLHENMKKDAKRYANMLADGKIDQEDFEMLMQGRMTQLKIELLSEVSISKAKFDDIAGDLFKVTVNTLIAAI